MFKKGKRIRHLFLVGFTVLLFSAAWNVYSLVRDLPNPERITERDVAQSTKIFDRTGTTTLYEIHGEEKRTVVSLDQIPAYVKFATLTAEDINFYSHIGLDWRGILRAMIKNVQSRDISQGGSTITQQLVKNSILTPERTFTRKFKEAILSLILESKYSKEEILELYLNQIPYGSNAYGIATAAETFFGKAVEDLTIAESATLAALPKAPTYYSPHGSNKDKLTERKNWILTTMERAGFITARELAEAQDTELVFISPSQSIRAPHFVLYVREYLNEKYGEEFVTRGGLKVITTLDWRLQQEAEKAVQEGGERNKELVEAYNAALTAVNPQTGEILAMVGSRDYWTESEPAGCTPGVDCLFDPHVNVTNRKRQPGSAFKPFVYATAIKQGFTPETVLFDVSTQFNPLCNPDGTPGPLINDPETCYQPGNYDDQFRGPVTVRQSLAQSLNVPSVKLLYLAGINESIQTAEEMGLSTLTEPDRYGLSLVLGGAEVTLLEMTSAFGVFGQEGILHPKTAILRIEDANGRVLEEKKEESFPVLDTEVSRVMNNLLSDNEARLPMFSPRSSLFFEGRDVAAKTGTTQDFRDAWVIGYTPSIAAGVWVGNNNNAPMNKSALSIMVAGPIWHAFLDSVLKSTPPEYFTPPEEKTVINPVLKGNYRSGEAVVIDKISKKRATQFTPPELREEVFFGSVQNILGLLKKDNPLGEPPANPAEDDTQFKNWQAAVNGWITETNFATSTPPEETDDLHTPETQPKISVLNVSSDDESVRNIDSLIVNIKAPFPLQEVSLFVNGELVESKTAPIISSTIPFSLGNPLPPGIQSIKITAFDVVGNQAAEELSLTVIQ